MHAQFMRIYYNFRVIQDFKLNCVPVLKYLPWIPDQVRNDNEVESKAFPLDSGSSPE